MGGSTAVAYGGEAVGDVQITAAAVSGGKDVAIGLADKTVTGSVTATDPSGIWDADFHLWRGADPDNPDGYLKPNEDTTPVDCVASSATTSTCSKTFTFEPDSWLTNADAGTWTLQTVNTSSTGDLKATATASAAGYLRWNFTGASTTPAVKATGDYVDVQ
ncbi:hypothetical protein [Streptomyces sp. CA2R101]|uniref:hypothetical protein n=1 Tax=Streptomyces sp. CA2R101 TaxID=3120152 RepID=UPI00300A68D4